jgi:hypothetical protein
MSGDNASAGMIIGVTVAGGVSAAVFVCATSWWAIKACYEGRLSRGWRRLRVRRLGGVTNLEQALPYDCALCGHSLDHGEEVRTLSCGHVFHLRKSAAKCRNSIDDWLRENRVRCPACCKTFCPVWPSKPPTSAPLAAPAPPPPPSDLELQIPRLLASDDQASISSQWLQDTLRSPSQ